MYDKFWSYHEHNYWKVCAKIEISANSDVGVVLRKAVERVKNMTSFRHIMHYKFDIILNNTKIVFNEDKNVFVEDSHQLLWQSYHK